MAANAVVPSKTLLAGFWDRFQRVAAQRVQECNAIAGEPLWLTAAAADPSPLFAVRSTERSENSVECTFDFEEGMLICKPGPAVPAETLVFRWESGTADCLRSGTRDFTLDQAVCQILDELVWIEPCGCDELLEEEAAN